MNMTPEARAEARARCEAAETAQLEKAILDPVGDLERWFSRNNDEWVEGLSEPQMDALNAVMVMRQDFRDWWPRLVARLDAQDAELAELRAEVERMRKALEKTLPYVYQEMCRPDCPVCLEAKAIRDLALAALTPKEDSR